MPPLKNRDITAVLTGRTLFNAAANFLPGESKEKAPRKSDLLSRWACLFQFVFNLE